MNLAPRTYAVTGTASGMGKAVRERLETAGARVIGIDLHDADVLADLGTSEGRHAMVEGVAQRADGTLDAVIACAGVRFRVDGIAGGSDPATVVRVDYFGVVEPLVALRPLLGQALEPRVAVVSSGGAALGSSDDDEGVAACLAGEEETAVAACATDGFRAYCVAKRSLARWVRREAVTAEWAGLGIPLNAVAPGPIETPMAEPILGHERVERAPLRGFGSPEQVASLLCWLTSPDNGFVTGQVIFIDGGNEAARRGNAVF